MFFQLPAQSLSYYKFNCILKRIYYLSKHFSECILDSQNVCLYWNLQNVVRLNTGGMFYCQPISWCLILFKVSVFTAGSYEKPHKQEWGFHTAKVIHTLIILIDKSYVLAF